MKINGKSSNGKSDSLKFKISAGVCTTRGVVKKVNEDNFLINTDTLKKESFYGKRKINATDFGVFAICDGMGGAKYGKEASSFVVSELKEKIECFQGEISVEYIKYLVRDLNNRLVKKYKTGAGTTLAFIVIANRKIYYANVGDSRIYLFLKNQLQKISEDHNQASEFEREGYGGSNGRNILTQYMGIPEEEMIIEPHIGEMECQKDLIILLCSDGVNEGMNDSILEELLRKKKNRSSISIAAYIVKNAIKGKSKDNTTSIIVKIK